MRRRLAIKVQNTCCNCWFVFVLFVWYICFCMVHWFCFLMCFSKCLFYFADAFLCWFFLSFPFPFFNCFFTIAARHQTSTKQNKWFVTQILEWKNDFSIWNGVSSAEKVIGSRDFDMNCKEFTSSGERQNFSNLVIFQTELILV